MKKYINNIKNKINLPEQEIDNISKELLFYYDEQEKIKKEIERIKYTVTEYDNPNINELYFKKIFSKNLFYISLAGAAISPFFMGGSLLLTSFFIGTSVVSKYNFNKTINEIESYKNSISNKKTKTLMRLEEKSKNINEKIYNLNSKKSNKINNTFYIEENKNDEPAKVLTLKKR